MKVTGHHLMWGASVFAGPSKSVSLTGGTVFYLLDDGSPLKHADISYQIQLAIRDSIEETGRQKGIEISDNYRIDFVSKLFEVEIPDDKKHLHIYNGFIYRTGAKK